MSNPGPPSKSDNPRPNRSSKLIEDNLNDIASTIRRGEQTAPELDFEQVYAENRGRVYSTAYRFLHNRHDAEDVTQDVFVKVFKKLSSFRGESSVSTWLYRITVNSCMDFLRKTRQRPVVSVEDCPNLSTSSLSLKGLIESVVAELPQGYRSVFILHDIQGLKHFEIAEVLEISEGASKSQLHRARAQLRQRLAPYVKDWRWR